MKIVFDTDACKKNNRDIDLILYLISFVAGTKITLNTFEKARQQHFLKFDKPYNRNSLFPDYVELSSEGEFLVESIMADSNSGICPTVNDRFLNLANKLREIFPAGKKPGYAYTWRDSPSIIADRLKKFTLKFGEYSDEDIIEATKRYVDSFNGDYKYMQLLKYFIWKNKVTGSDYIDGRIVGEVEKQSQLASYLENKEETVATTDWDIEIR